MPENNTQGVDRWGNTWTQDAFGNITVDLQQQVLTFTANATATQGVPFQTPWPAVNQRFQTPVVPKAPDPEDTEMLHVVNKFKVGCDPEFLMIDKQTGRIIPANKYLPAGGPIGYDHGGRVAEFRPQPSRLIARVVKRLNTLINDDDLLRPARPLKWRAGGVYPRGDGHQESLGGHVHLDIPYGGYRGYDAPAERPVTATVEACDRLTRAFEHLDILPTTEAQARRRSGNGYGRFGDIRESHGHLEYRTPLSWLHKPETAYLVLTGYKLAAASPRTTEGARLGTPDGLWDFFRGFASDDDDARRVVEKLTLRKVQGDPDADFKLFWEGQAV